MPVILPEKPKNPWDLPTGSGDAIQQWRESFPCLRVTGKNVWADDAPRKAAVDVSGGGFGVDVTRGGGFGADAVRGGGFGADVVRGGGFGVDAVRGGGFGNVDVRPPASKTRRDEVRLADFCSVGLRASRRRRGWDLDRPWTSRGAAAAGTWIVRGRVAAPPRLEPGSSVDASRRR